MAQLTAISTLLLAVLAACTPDQDVDPVAGFPGPADPAISILDVIDGDTIRISSSTTGEVKSARLVGFDTPETYEPGCAAERDLGNAATRRLQVILRDATAIDPTPLGFDRYQRVLLRLVIDGRDLADIMVSEGLAVRYDGGRRINWCQRLGAG